MSKIGLGVKTLPVYVLNGKKTTKEQMNSISSNQIQSVSFLNQPTDTAKHVCLQAEFPGGIPAWTRYLERNLRVQVPVDNKAPIGTYTVIVTFHIDKEGNVSDIKAINKPKEDYGTSSEAIRVIERSGKWTPATIDGNAVDFVQKQKINFNVSK